MNEKEIVGVVEAVSRREGRYGLKVHGAWYDGWGEAPASEGACVRIRFREVYKDNGKTYRNVHGVDVVVPDGAARGSQLNGNGSFRDRVNRAVSLKAACAVMAGNGAHPDKIFELADALLTWLDGSVDNGVSASSAVGGAEQEDEASASASPMCAHDPAVSGTGGYLCEECQASGTLSVPLDLNRPEVRL